MTKLTAIELMQEANHFSRLFTERVLAGTVYDQKDDRYAIASPWRPQAISWTPTSNAPQRIGFNAQELSSRLQSSENIPDIAWIRQNFNDIQMNLKRLNTYLDSLPERDQPRYVRENIDAYLPDIKSFIKAADKTLGPSLL